MSGNDNRIAGTAVAQQAVGTEARSVAGILSRPAACVLALTFLLAIATVRIVSTYRVFNHTIDEPAHIACGIEWLEKGVYRYETLHPPLARISVALGPYLAGVRGTGAPAMWGEATRILSADGHYWRNLALARAGVLPYFVLAAAVVFLWAKRLFGAPTGLLAAAIFTLLPTVLAHSGLATTDIPFTALFCWALYAFTLWLREPGWRTAAQFGIAAGLALSAKFSTIVFLPACTAAIFAMYLAAGQPRWSALLRTSAAIMVCGFFVTWAAYRFSHTPVNHVTQIAETAAVKVFGRPSQVTSAVHRIASKVQMPAPELFDGIRSLRQQNSHGRLASLFGHVTRGGWWYFFFASLAVKTPLAVLLLAAVGTGALVLGYLRDRHHWESPAPLAAAVMVMIVTAPSRFNIGVRHILPVFAFLSILAAIGLAALWKRRDRSPLFRLAAIVLFAWLSISSAWSHPDYISYFNEFGGSDPSRILVDSDIDWGQDLARLATWLRGHHVTHVSVVYGGVFDPDALGFPETEKIECGAAAPRGWTATELFETRLHPECYPWLPQQHSLAGVGRTMRIYYVPGP